MTICRLAITLSLMAGTAFAAGSGDHSHGDALAVGKPAPDSEADRTVEIKMIETDSGMGFEPAELTVEKGETIRFVVTNAGQLEHEIVLGTEESNLDHQEEMAGMDGEMQHDDPNALTLDPGAEGELVWTFSNAGTFQYACLIPGHMEAGMHGPITVD